MRDEAPIVVVETSASITGPVMNFRYLIGKFGNEAVGNTEILPK
jgi:hypothetical protein